jgi:thiol-disulfide isomerase/thioredoxin
LAGGIYHARFRFAFKDLQNIVELFAMKKIIFTCFVLLLSTLAAFPQTEGIVWEKDFKKAKQMARETGRPLLLDFTADWCKPCKMMDKEFWVRDDVIQAAKPCIAVKINFDTQNNIAAGYGVKSIPYVLFADPLGNMITFRLGFSKKNATELSAIFEEMPKDFSPMLKFYDALDQKKDDGRALFQIANAYRGAKMLKLSNEFYKKALKTDEIQADEEKRINSFLSLGVNYLNLKDFEQAAAVMKDFLKTNPTGEMRETGLYFITLATAYDGKFNDADKYLQMLKTEFPSSRNVAQAEAAIEAKKNQPKKKD